MPPLSSASPAGSQTLTAGSPDAPRHVVIFHGYTSSPDEFRELADRLASKLNAYVTAPLMPGHGTSLDDLRKLSFDDLASFAKQYVRSFAEKNRPLAILGHSFGGYLAVIAAAEVETKAVVMTVTPYTLRYPLVIPGAELFMRLRREWPKKMSTQEIADRLGTFYYKAMPSMALSLVKKGIRTINKILPTMSLPVLTIHTREDPLALPESGVNILKKTKGNSDSKSMILENRRHGIFYGAYREEVVSAITDFLERELVSA